MRLIDADVLCDYIKACSIGDGIGHTSKDFLEAVNKQPTIEVWNTRKPMDRYEELKRKLQSVYGECDGLLEKVVEGLVKHEGVEFAKPMKARLLTDVDVDKWDQLKGSRNRIIRRLIDEGLPFPTEDKDVGFSDGISRAIEIIKEEMSC